MTSGDPASGTHSQAPVADTERTGATDVPITAIALNHRVDLNNISPPPVWRELGRHPYATIYETRAGSSVFVFDFGAVVIDGLASLGDGLGRQIESITGCRLLPATSDTYLITTDPAKADGSVRVGWDRVVIPERSVDLVAAVALLIAQSAALERYEQAVELLLDDSLALSRDLAGRVALPQSTRGLIERVGRLTSDRLELARWFFLVDRPEATWESSRVAELYDALFVNLELRQRHHAMLHKLEAVERATESVINLWQGRRSNALEWAIVILIVVEIVFGLSGVL